MKLQDCYTKLEGDYQGVLGRLIREASVSKFLIMMLKDTQLDELHKGLETSDWESAFRAAHTMKGTCLNLGISKLAGYASTLTEALRGGAPSVDISGMVADVEQEYYRTKEIITEYSENPEI